LNFRLNLFYSIDSWCGQSSFASLYQCWSFVTRLSALIHSVRCDDHFYQIRDKITTTRPFQESNKIKRFCLYLRIFLPLYCINFVRALKASIFLNRAWKKYVFSSTMFTMKIKKGPPRIGPFDIHCPPLYYGSGSQFDREYPCSLESVVLNVRSLEAHFFRRDNFFDPPN